GSIACDSTPDQCLQRALVVSRQGVLRPQAVPVPADRGDRRDLRAAPESDEGVIGHQVADYHLFLPTGRVAGQVDANVVVLAPEERRVGELGLTEHVSGRGLTLTLGHEPVLDADRVPPGSGIT